MLTKPEDIICIVKPLHTIKGKVITGAKRGRKLGYPTANIDLEQKIPQGIYASVVIDGPTDYKAATFIGKSKTFGEKDYKLESYLLDFGGNLYGKEITVKLYKKIRGNKKFQSSGLLAENIKRDVENVRKYFGERQNKVT